MDWMLLKHKSINNRTWNFDSKRNRKEQVREDVLEVEQSMSKPEEGKVLLISILH